MRARPGCAARTARASGAASPAGRSRRASRRRATSGCARTSPKGSAPTRLCIGCCASRTRCSISVRGLQAVDPSLGSVWLFEDITRQHEAEERIERALAEQELILDNATVGIAFVRNRSIQRCNRYLEEMVGAGPGELVGQSSEILFADRDDWQRAGALAYVTTAPGGTHDAEWRFKRRDGAAFRRRTRGRLIDAGPEAQAW